jgi:hypothetical protein
MLFSSKKHSCLINNLNIIYVIAYSSDHLGTYIVASARSFLHKCRCSSHPRLDLQYFLKTEISVTNLSFYWMHFLFFVFDICHDNLDLYIKIQCKQ